MYKNDDKHKYIFKDALDQWLFYNNYDSTKMHTHS